MHLLKFEEAESILAFLQKSSKKFDDPDIKDRLLIYELYCNLMVGKDVNIRRVRYRFNRINQEKEEVLIPFKVGEIVYLYIYDRDKLYDKLDALNQFAYRVFRNPKYKRTSLFVKIVTQIMNDKPYDLGLMVNSTSISNNSLELVDYNYLIEFLLKKKN